MMKALFTAATGMKGQQMSVDVISNNIANVNTNGFKRSRINFQDLLYVTLRKAGDASQGIQSPTGFEIGSGVRAVSTTRTFSQGVMEGTQRPLDIAISGRGFFQVTMPDGTTGYTRDGALHLDANLTLTTSEGYILEPQITFPTNVDSISFGADGTISATTTDSPETPTQLGQLQLATFPNEAGLDPLGGNLFRPGAASGTATVVTPGQSGAGTIIQGYIEKSNVDVVSELVNLIVAQRAYEVNSRAIRTGDEMLSQVNGLVR
ncbi:MAG: flagellar basal-body rod protein FlgG [Planctomycetota bacterium]